MAAVGSRESGVGGMTVQLEIAGRDGRLLGKGADLADERLLGEYDGRDGWMRFL